MPRRLYVPLLVLGVCLLAPAVAIAKARDRDHDGLPDRWERRYHLSTHHKSAKGDADHDRITNRGEYRSHTNPRRRDTDRDGLGDWSEIVRWRTNPRRRDTDGDGFSDRAEIRAGTNPRSRASHPTTTSKGGSAGAQPPAGAASGTATPAAGAGKLACTTATPNVAGGPDPWGNCWPGATNVGIPAGTALTGYTGPCTITANNTVIDRKVISCSLTIQASGVQITNSKLNGTIYLDSPNTPYSFSISDSEVDAGGPLNSGIGKDNFVATRVHVHGGYRGIWCENNCTVQDSYVHAQATDPSGAAHESALRMGAGSVIRHNALQCDAPNVAPDAGCSADLTGYGDFAPIQNDTIANNLFLATTGGTCAYGGSSGADGSKPYGNQAANIVFTGNVFQRRSAVQGSGNCGFWFPISDFDRSRPGNQWVNNVWDTGGAVSPG